MRQWIGKTSDEGELIMRRLFITFGIAAGLSINSHAGLITHTDYLSGGVITAAGQNSNENTIFNEFNGNIDNNNIKTGGIQATNIANNVLTFTQLGTVLSSSITISQNFATYRRPVLLYNGASTVSLEEGIDGNANEVLIIFPDGQARKDSTTLHLNCVLTQTANFTSGTIQGGILSGVTLTNNNWYALYAVKSQAASTDFVTVATQYTPVIGDITLLNNAFGTNAWVYLGMIAYGDNLTIPNQVVPFVMSGNQTIFNNTATTSGVTCTGVMIATATAATSVTYTDSIGLTFGKRPDTLVLSLMGVAKPYDASGKGSQITDSAGMINYGYNVDGAASIGRVDKYWVTTAKGMKATDYNSGTGLTWNIMLFGFVDAALGVGANPLF